MSCLRTLAFSCFLAAVAAPLERASAAPASYRDGFGQAHSQGAFFDITSEHTINIPGIAIASDRKERFLVLADWRTSGELGVQCAVTRYTRGARMLDMDFSGSGETGDLEATRRITLGLSGSAYDRCTTLTTDSSSRVVVGGYAFTVGNDAKAFLIRLNSGGAYDTNFGNNGRFRLDSAATTFLFTETRFTDIKASSASRTLACGFVRRPSGNNMLVARVLSSGELDPAFNGTGYNEIAFDAGGTNDDECVRVVELPDGKITVVGNVANDGTRNIGMARLKSTGELDTGFYGDGKYIVPTPAGLATPEAADVVYDAPRSRYLIATTISGPAFTPSAQVVAIGNSGGLNESFGADGRLSFRFSALGGRATGATTAGRILLADSTFYLLGTHENTGTDLTNYGVDDTGIARFHLDGSVDTGFSGDGVAYYGVDSPTYQKVPDGSRRHIGETFKDAIWYEGAVTLLTDTNRFPAGYYDGANHDLGPVAPQVTSIVSEALFTSDFEFDGLAEPTTEPPTISVPLGYGSYCSVHQPGHPTVFGLSAQGYDSDPCGQYLAQNASLVVDRAGLYSLTGQNNAMAVCSGNYIVLQSGNGTTPINAVFAATAGQSNCIFTIAPQNLPIFNRPYTGNHLPADQPAQSFNHNSYGYDGLHASDFGQSALTPGHTDAHSIDLYGRQHCYVSGSSHQITGGVDEPASDILVQNDRQVISMAVGRVASAVPRNVTPFTPAGNDPWQREVFIRHQVGSGRYSEQFTTYYAHLPNTLVRRGDVLPAATVLGQVGTTGASSGYHLHISVNRNTNLNYLGTWEHSYKQEGFDVDKAVSAIDPWGWRAPQNIDPWAWRFRDYHNAGTGVWSIKLWKAGEEPTIN